MPRAALFDVDGTLIDSNHLHVVTWWEALRQGGHSVRMADIHRAIGLGSEDLLAHLLGDDRDSAQDTTVSAAHKTLYATYFERLHAFDGAADLLRTLAEREWRVVLATSAGGEELSAMRRALDADDALTAEARADQVDAGKPAPDPVEEALRQAGADAKDAVFVGDSVWDMEAASRAGVRAVAVLSGGVPRAALEAAGAGAVYSSVAELLSDLDTGPFSAV
ncbi:HAD family hydrolase [Streptomyces sp. NBC_01497]|uniref:HAD family hydrolase n=1 Tax=Streptomyces sp. NBC_01497 TaxID=2903885 RepID=UPI002E32F036|nr:HAD family hydrolase [Streptomyces sp. NBC_01497]